MIHANVAAQKQYRKTFQFGILNVCCDDFIVHSNVRFAVRLEIKFIAINWS